ncbi:hypothetical protein J3R83DRAFT_6598 [Lanmaoa asiatica]|nr:hypothetical protein J3R83DRAFT_6598 [Lanmaoa asiatica]
MYLLPTHTVELVLQYISPLTDPLPPHLISTPLRQRHHFLQISPSSPVEYLCWPSPDNAKTIDLLDSLPPLSDQACYPTRYTSDPESTFAHVQISSDAEGLRMLFHWDDIHGWRYHDLQLMPFPSSSLSTPRQSLASNSAGPARLPSLDLVAEADHTSSGSDDSYWDSYGAAGHDLTFSLPLRSESKPNAVEGEDAYWAQYASVQGCYFCSNTSRKNSQPNSDASLGSADSTRTSPLPINRNLRHVNSNDDESVFSDSFPPRHDSIIDVPVHAIHSCPPASRLGPPSPDMLAHLLNTISPRKDTCSPVPDDPYSLQSPSAYSIDPSPEQTLADSELVTPPLPDRHADAAVVSPVAVKVNGVPPPKCRPRPRGEAEDRALTDSIKGLYYLWRVGRKGESEEKDRNVFLRIIQAAIASNK